MRSNEVDAPYIFKSLDFEFGDLLRQTFNTPFILLRYLAHFLYGVVNLHRTGCHFVHAFSDDTGEAIKLLHFLCDALSAFQHFFRTCLYFYRYGVDVLDSCQHFSAAVFLFAHGFSQPVAHILNLFGKVKNCIEFFFHRFG